MQHHFDKDIAVKYGIIEAILLNNIQIWLEKNKANNVNTDNNQNKITDYFNNNIGPMFLDD